MISTMLRCLSILTLLSIRTRVFHVRRRLKYCLENHRETSNVWQHCTITRILHPILALYWHRTIQLPLRTFVTNIPCKTNIFNIPHNQRTRGRKQKFIGNRISRENDWLISHIKREISNIPTSCALLQLNSMNCTRNLEDGIL